MEGLYPNTWKGQAALALEAMMGEDHFNLGVQGQQHNYPFFKKTMLCPGMAAPTCSPRTGNELEASLKSCHTVAQQLAG